MPTLMPSPFGSYGAGISLANDFWDQIYGVGGVDFGALTNSYIGLASGRVFGTNPPYTVTDFLGVYSKFFGPPATFTGTTIAPTRVRTSITQGSNVIVVNDATGIVDGYLVCGIGIDQNTTVTAVSGTNITISTDGLVNTSSIVTFSDPTTYNVISYSGAAPAGLAIGQLVTGPGIAGGTVVKSLAANVITLSLPIVCSQTDAIFTYYTAPFVPLMVLQLYINAAQASIMQARWLELWPMAMALYVAHFTTLWMQTETAGPNSTAAQIAASGLQQGILISEAAGDVSAGFTPVPGLEDWGTYNLTAYGSQLATFAQSIGAGPIYVGSAVASPGYYQ